MATTACICVIIVSEKGSRRTAPVRATHLRFTFRGFII